MHDDSHYPEAMSLLRLCQGSQYARSSLRHQACKRNSMIRTRSYQVNQVGVQTTVPAYGHILQFNGVCGHAFHMHAEAHALAYPGATHHQLSSNSTTLTSVTVVSQSILQGPSQLLTGPVDYWLRQALSFIKRTWQPKKHK